MTAPKKKTVRRAKPIDPPLKKVAILTNEVNAYARLFADFLAAMGIEPDPPGSTALLVLGYYGLLTQGATLDSLSNVAKMACDMAYDSRIQYLTQRLKEGHREAQEELQVRTIEHMPVSDGSKPN